MRRLSNGIVGPAIRSRRTNLWPIHRVDIREFDYANLPPIELVSGGPPCQPFSMGGKHHAYLDPRDMFPQAIRAVRELHPKAFIFENVKGLRRATFSNYLEYIRLQLRHPELLTKPEESWSEHFARLERHESSGRHEGLHYHVVVRLLNAANYGVPQKRERVFLVGFRSDLGIEWNFPEETHSLRALAWSQGPNGDYWDHHNILHKDHAIIVGPLREEPATKPWVTVRDALLGLLIPNSSVRLQKRFLIIASYRARALIPGIREVRSTYQLRPLRRVFMVFPVVKTCCVGRTGLFAIFRCAKARASKPSQMTFCFTAVGVRRCASLATRCR